MRNKRVLLILITLIFFSSFRIEVEKGDAIVEQQQGLYIFLLSKPKSKYDYLGSVKKSIAWTGQPDEMLGSIIKKVKKEYPSANAVIFTSILMDKADAVKIND